MSFLGAPGCPADLVPCQSWVLALSQLLRKPQRSPTAQPIGDELLQQKLLAFQGPFPKVFFPSEKLVGSGLTSLPQA